MAQSLISLHWADYAFFGVVLAVSIGIGIYHACAGSKQRTTAEYLVGNRKMSVLPVSFSYVVTYMSSIFMLGLPAEMYVYGLTYIFNFFSILVANTLTVVVAVPLFHPLRLTSSYEYLEKRFDSLAVRKMGALFGILLNTLYMGVVLYGPAVALDTVAGFPLWASVFLVGIASIIYTSIGGIKAVIWTDVFQCMIIVIGLTAILVKSIVEVGGFGNFWKHNVESGRFDINWSFDPTVRTTFWNCMLAGGVGWFGVAFNQASVQRIAAMPTKRHATKMVLLSIPGFLFLAVAASLEGFAAYAYYKSKDCDPFSAHYISNSNEILPYFVMELFQTLPGLAGLFLASLFSASLSTLSSGLNGISANTLMDFVTPFYPNMSELKRTVLAKIFVLIFGFISIGISFLVMKIGGPVTQICTSLLGSLGGPVSGLFLVGAFFPWANSKGALVGGLCGFGICMWITLGAQVTGVKTPWLPLGGTDSCTTNVTHFLIANSSAVTVMKTPESLVGLERFYALSFTTYSLIGLVVAFVVCILVSAVTGFKKPKDVNPLFVSHLIRGLFFTEKEIETALQERKRLNLELIVKPYGDDLKDKVDTGDGNVLKPVTQPPHLAGSLRRPLMQDPDDGPSWRDHDIATRRM